MTSPTILLVHGAFSDASIWLKVTLDLQHRGLRVFCPALLTVNLNYYDSGNWSDEIRRTETQDTLALTEALNRLWESGWKHYAENLLFKLG